MKGDRTLWSNEEKKFQPVNKQAAMIARRATGLHVHPEIPKQPVFEPTFDQMLEAECRERRLKIETLESELPAKKPNQKRRLPQGWKGRRGHRASKTKGRI